MKLTHINAAPAQTWNWLSINDTSVELPETLGKLTRTGLEEALSETSLSKAEKTLVENPALGPLVKISAGATKLAAVIEESATKKNEFIADQPTSSSQHFLVFLDKENPVQTTYIQVKKGCSATLSVGALGKETDTFATAHALYVDLEEGAKLTLYHLVAENDAQMHLETVGAKIGEGATFEPHQFFLGSKETVFGLSANLPDKDGNFAGKSSYTVSADQTLDLTFNLFQGGVKTKSNLTLAGVLSDNAKKTLRATIDLQKGCKGASGTENETVILAGEHVVNKTLPTILCAEDDVEGNHGATIGSLSPEMLFYLGCRGLTEDDATDLMQEAILDDAAANLPEELSEAALNWAQWAIGPNAYETALAAKELKSAPKESHV